MKQFYGTGIAIVTPFKEDFSIDHEALASIVDYNIKNGVDYIVICGTTGESVTTTREEKKQLVATINEANNNRVPMVYGIGGNNTQAVIEEIKTTDLSLMEGLLSVSPYYSKPQQEGIYQHFKAVGKASPIPVILYNVPGRTSSNMLPETTLRLAKDVDNIVAVKEAGNNVAQYLKLLQHKPEDFLILSGDDDLALGVILAGGAGVISVIGQGLPKEFTSMVNLGLVGKATEAYKYHFDLMDLTSLIFKENNPAGIKGVLSQLGYCRDTVRLPLVPATDSLKVEIRTALKKLNYIN
ncbi:4-hydroxy-tetrahydrodipicolinate synthase [Aegicerativicinus sediminis]|uniref:4-hydroxy-tetrahydrodipicolinate synthase n=1 Tax=Aegicerativicinus sediminis TaxID=2893202 RepID=UPI001E2BEEED|nr:4-hydroxy-tetrahydrodipicolinate synthase [Aegicerativicinus sediminis]